MGLLHLYPYPLPLIIQGTEHRSWLLCWYSCCYLDSHSTGNTYKSFKLYISQKQPWLGFDVSFSFGFFSTWCLEYFFLWPWLWAWMGQYSGWMLYLKINTNLASVLCFLILFLWCVHMTESFCTDNALGRTLHKASEAASVMVRGFIDVQHTADSFICDGNVNAFTL